MDNNFPDYEPEINVSDLPPEFDLRRRLEEKLKRKRDGDDEKDSDETKRHQRDDRIEESDQIGRTSSIGSDQTVRNRISNLFGGGDRQIGRKYDGVGIKIIKRNVDIGDDKRIIHGDDDDDRGDHDDNRGKETNGESTSNVKKSTDSKKKSAKKLIKSTIPTDSTETSILEKPTESIVHSAPTTSNKPERSIVVEDQSAAESMADSKKKSKKSKKKKHKKEKDDESKEDDGNGATTKKHRKEKKKKTSDESKEIDKSTPKSTKSISSAVVLMPPMDSSTMLMVPMPPPSRWDHDRYDEISNEPKLSSAVVRPSSVIASVSTSTTAASSRTNRSIADDDAARSRTTRSIAGDGRSSTVRSITDPDRWRSDRWKDESSSSTFETNRASSRDYDRHSSIEKDRSWSKSSSNYYPSNRSSVPPGSFEYRSADRAASVSTTSYSHRSNRSSYDRGGSKGRESVSRYDGTSLTTSKHPRKSYTGYDLDGRSTSPILRMEDTTTDGESRQPSPPKDMPEHIRWLHERWSKYDRSFFTGGSSNGGQPTKDGGEISGSKSTAIDSSTTGSSAATSATSGRDSRDHRDYPRRDSYDDRRASSSSRNRDSYDHRRGDSSRGGRSDPKSRYALPYYQFRKGGTQSTSVGGIGSTHFMSLKEFIVTQPAGDDDLTNDEHEALRLYDEYKLEYKRRMYADFFQSHQDNEWFLEKYHPTFKTEKESKRRDAIQKRLDVFMQLLVRGWMDASLDVDDSRRIRKLLDACIVLLEGGDESDLNALSDLDYILEEKKEEAAELERLRKETEAREAAEAAAMEAAEDEDEADGEDNEEKRERRRQRRLRMDEEKKEAEGKQHDPNELELMQHARDYSLYVKEHLQEQNVDISDQPDLISAVRTKTKYVGDGMFVQELVTTTPIGGDTTSDEMTTLHKSSAIIIRNIPPFAKRADLERMCSEVHGGYLRLFLSEPDPTANAFARYAVASYWSNANLTKIIWALRGRKIGAAQLSIGEFRDFTEKRIAFVDGLAADKSVVLRDIQLCKSLIEYLDKKHRLWETPTQEGQPQSTPMVNPLLVNLDECLAFHLQQLIDSGRLVPPQTSTSNSTIDRDPNLTKILDRLILYLRVVHSIDYYGCRFDETEDDRPRRIGLVHIRGPQTCSRAATSKNLASYIREFETRLKDIMPQEARLSDAHVEVLGKRNTHDEIDRYVRANIVQAEERGMAQCCMCLKRFTSEEFARAHINERHAERFDEIRWIVRCFNNYLADPNRPCNASVMTA